MILEKLTDLRIPNDSGPIYRETMMGRFPVEPFNTISNLVFLLIIVYFSAKVYKDPKQQLFLACCLPILTVGFIGGTIFHSTRDHQLWLLMDWVPIMVLCIAAVFYFIIKLYHTWNKRIVVFLLIMALSFIVRMLPISEGIRISLGYVITAITVIAPITLYLIKTKGRYKKLIFAAVFSFIIAVTCRSVDKSLDIRYVYMGTHWLWHVFGGISVFFLMLFVYKDQLSENMDS